MWFFFVFCGGKSKRGNRARIGETYAGPEDQLNDDTEMEGAALQEASGTEGEEVREPTLRDLASIIQDFMGNRRPVN